MSEEFTRSYYHQPSDADNHDLRHRTTAEQMFDPDSYLSFSEFFNGSYNDILDQNLFPSSEGISVVRGEEATPNSSISSASENDENSNKGKKNLHELNKSFKQDDREKKRKPERQARYAFMTKSEVDHLEDGYRWRKYGQKAVKNNAYPRSYYRCTTQKCGVKKRVERSFEDPSVVVTTYEGQHNHRIPVALRGHVITTSGMFGPACSEGPSGFSQELLLAQMQQPYGGDANNRYPDNGLLQDIIPPPMVFPKLQDRE